MERIIGVVLWLVIALQGSDVVWINPTHQVCTQYAGSYDTNGTCKSYEKNIKQICKASGGRVPILDDFRYLIELCGGNMTYFDSFDRSKNQIEKNKHNQTYQNCYTRQGFKPKYRYWTSTAHSVNDSSLIYVYLDDGVYDWYDSWIGIVRCIKE